MDRNALQADRPAPRVRCLLVAEVLLFLGVMAVYMNVGLPSGDPIRVVDVAAYVFAGAFPIAMNLLHGDRPADSGLRVDNLLGSLKEVGAATAAMAAGVLIVAAAVRGFHWDTPGDVALHFGGYLGWGLVQQYWMQAFALRRFRQAGVPRKAVVPLAAALFGLVHAPNWPLVALTGGAALAWCSLFVRKPNLFTLALSHAVLAVLVRYSLPDAWLHRLAVGGMYVQKVLEGG
jgi:hypothetical protein